MFRHISHITVMEPEELYLLYLDMVLYISNKSGYSDRLYNFSFVFVKIDRLFGLVVRVLG
jgi:hypothetical protein